MARFRRVEKHVARSPQEIADAAAWAAVLGKLRGVFERMNRVTIISDKSLWFTLRDHHVNMFKGVSPTLYSAVRVLSGKLAVITYAIDEFRGQCPWSLDEYE